MGQNLPPSRFASENHSSQGTAVRIGFILPFKSDSFFPKNSWPHQMHSAKRIPGHFRFVLLKEFLFISILFSKRIPGHIKYILPKVFLATSDSFFPKYSWPHQIHSSRRIPWHDVMKIFSCSTQLSMKFFLSINVKMPTNCWHINIYEQKNSVIGLFEPQKR